MWKFNNFKTKITINYISKVINKLFLFLMERSKIICVDLDRKFCILREKVMSHYIGDGECEVASAYMHVWFSYLRDSEVDQVV